MQLEVEADEAETEGVEEGVAGQMAVVEVVEQLQCDGRTGQEVNHPGASALQPFPPFAF